MERIADSMAIGGITGGVEMDNVQNKIEVLV